jgi:hypothetical protein
MANATGTSIANSTISSTMPINPTITGSIYSPFFPISSFFQVLIICMGTISSMGIIEMANA